MDFCCRLGGEYISKKNILYESENFFVVPTLGQMGIEGYVLLCSKKHYLGVGNIPKEQIAELEVVLEKIKKILSEVYKSEVLVFEHGPKLACNSGGGCLDHFHLHIVPTSIDVMKFLKEKFEVKEIKDFEKIRKIYSEQKLSYMFVESQDKKRYIIEVNFPIPSQYLRQIIAAKMGTSEWDWKVNPDNKTFKNTIKRLKGKF